MDLCVSTCEVEDDNRGCVRPHRSRNTTTTEFVCLFLQFGKVEIREKAPSRKILEQEIGKTLYRVGKIKKRKKETDFEILRVPEDGRMLPTFSKDVRETVQCETSKNKEPQRRSCIFPVSGI